MNDIYRLHIDDVGSLFEWELIEVKGKRPEPRSGFVAVCQTDSTGKDKLIIFGGAGDNHAKYNDVWTFSEGSWIEISHQN